MLVSIKAGGAGLNLVAPKLANLDSMNVDAVSVNDRLYVSRIDPVVVQATDATFLSNGWPFVASGVVCRHPCRRSRSSLPRDVGWLGRSHCDYLPTGTWHPL